MKISYNWLKDYVDIQKSPAELADDLSLFGHGVESIEKIGDDYVLDLEITPNRGDCLSILGIAREIAALHNSKINTDSLIVSSIGVFDEFNLSKKINVQIVDPVICPRFTARVIDRIKIGESPKWMQEKLQSYGFRPINNIVDITNFVMIELGQPLHAFDYDKIKNGLMRIRKARKNEEVITLDGVKRILNEGAIIIEDDEKIYDLAGIMGGKNSEVDDNTKTIILQGAIFDPVLIRRTSKELHHVTDASYRYERGVDFKGTTAAVERAASLIGQTSSGCQIGQMIDIQSQKFEPLKIEFSAKQINHLLGTNFSEKEITHYLERLGFKVSSCLAEVPSWRVRDVKIWQDLAEEVARLYGYQKIKKTILSRQPPAQENKEWEREQKIKDCLTNFGFTEVESYPYLSTKDLENAELDPKNCLEIKNPLSVETQFLRPDLLPSILKQIAKNPWSPQIKIFEIGTIFRKSGEEKQIAIASTIKVKVGQIDLKEVKPQILDKFKIRKKVYLQVMDLDNFAKKVSLPNSYKIEFPNIQYRPISAFPPVVFDLAIIVDQGTTEEKVEEIIKKTSPLVYYLELFDIYVGPQIPKGKKSLAYHITLSSYDHTLTTEQIKNVRQKIISNLKEKLNASIRGATV
jgi:phenylalanyl-tRNA synthetase beta chain